MLLNTLHSETLQLSIEMKILIKQLVLKISGQKAEIINQEIKE